MMELTKEEVRIIKKKTLDYVFYTLGRQQYDFKVCGLKKNQDKTQGSKWKTYLQAVSVMEHDGTSSNMKNQVFFDKINQRQVLPNEILLDLESEEEFREAMVKIRLLRGIGKRIFKTGSKGYHIHLFFTKPLNSTKKRDILEYFGGDLNKAGENTLIALENIPHWKSGKIKEEIKGEIYGRGITGF